MIIRNKLFLSVLLAFSSFFLISYIFYINESEMLDIRKDVLIKVSTIFSITVILNVISLFFVSRNEKKSFKKLIEGTKIIATGNLDYQIKISGNNEIAFLAAAFNGMTKKLQESYLNLEAEKNRFYQVIKQSPFSTQIFSLSGFILEINKACEEYWGVTYEDYAGYNILEDKQLEASGTLALIKRGFAGESLELPAIFYDPARIGRNGRARWVSAYIYPVKNYEGEINEIILVHMDITARIEAEKALELRSGELEKEMAKDDALLKSIGDGLIAMDENAKIIYVNPSAEKILGFVSEEFIGKPFYEVWQMKDESGEILPLKKRPIQIALKTNKLVKANSYYYVRKDGNKVAVAITATPILNKELLGVIVIFRDITKEKQIDKAKDEFVSIASHQLRTPLTGIRWVIERFIKKNKKLTPQERIYLNDIQISISNLSSLVDILLNVSRIEEGSISVTPQPLELVEFIKNYLNESQPLVMKKNLYLSFVGYPEILTVITDASVLRNIIQSLISNAIEYTPDKGKITVSLKKEKDNFLFIVNDTGIGIPKEEQSRVFDKFMRASNARTIKAGGTGLGLYIADQATKLLGGKVWFESEENKGTTFYVSLPLKSETQLGTKNLT